MGEEQTDTEPDARDLVLRREAERAARLSRMARRTGTLQTQDAAERVAELARLRAAGFGPTVIGRRIGLSCSRVCQLLRAALATVSE